MDEDDLMLVELVEAPQRQQAFRLHGAPFFVVPISPRDIALLPFQFAPVLHHQHFAIQILESVNVLRRRFGQCFRQLNRLRYCARCWPLVALHFRSYGGTLFFRRAEGVWRVHLSVRHKFQDRDIFPIGAAPLFDDGSAEAPRLSPHAHEILRDGGNVCQAFDFLHWYDPSR